MPAAAWRAVSAPVGHFGVFNWPTSIDENSKISCITSAQVLYKSCSTCNYVQLSVRVIVLKFNVLPVIKA